MNRIFSFRKTELATVIATMLLPTAVYALDFQKDHVELRVDTRISVGASMRVADRDADNIGISNGGRAYSTNGDDGNLAFDKGDLTASAAKITSDATLSSGNYGVFVRGSYVFDPTLKDKRYFNRANYGQPGKEAPLSEYQDRTAEVRDHLGNDAELLDAYVYGSNVLGTRTLTYKIGRQILNWGESTLVMNGLNSLVSGNANKLRVPGFEIDEALKPVGMAFASIDLVESLSVEGFYQFEWRRTDPDAAGSPLATNDFVGIGGTRANLSFAIPAENDIGSTTPRAPDNRPKDGGQYGGALRYYLSQFNGIELALYAAKYHSRLPLVSGISANEPLRPFGGSYFIEYPEDIRMYGLSFNSTLPYGWALQGEYSLKKDQPIQIDDVELLLTGLGIPSQLNPSLGGASGNQYIKGYRRFDVSQFDFTLTRVFGPAQWLRNDQTIFVAEFAYDHVQGMPSASELRFDAPATYQPGYDPATDGPARAGFLVNRGVFNTDGSREDLPANEAHYATANSWGYKLLARLTYNNAIGSVALNPTIRFDHDVKGYTPTPIGNFVEDRKLIGVSVGWTYHAAWSGDVGYTQYFGGGVQNLLSDRDFVTASLSYSF